MKFLSAVVLFFFGAALLFGIGFSFRDLERGQLPDRRALQALVGVSVESAPEQLLNHSFNLIRASYVRDVKPTPLRYAAIGGMISSLGDPHTMFLPPKEEEAFMFQTSQSLVGIGCSLYNDPRGVKLGDVFDASPAMKAGLQVGDVITAVDGVSIKGIARESVVSRIRGTEGTVVRLTVIKASHGQTVVVSARRAKVFAPTVSSSYFADSKIGYIGIATFSDPTVDQFDAKLDVLQKKGLNGLIIDLRGDPGGLLDTAVDLLARFFENKVVVKMRHRDGSEETASTPSNFTRNLNVPIAILMNEDSASASEIFAGCMHDYGLATLVGTHSYGKSSVQHIFPMTDGAGVKVTIARYYLPTTPYFGRVVDADGTYIKGGLQPDVPVKLDPNVEPVAGQPKTDAQLAKAIEVLTAKRP
ncbi:MAG: S41 family peptidase [Fimbriimonadaceae bacterium]